MKLRLVVGLLASILLLSVKPAAAITMYVDPAGQSIVSGTSTSLDVSINGFGNFEANSLGKFELDVIYDDSILAFESITFTDFLGDLGSGNANSSFDSSVSGQIGASNVTFMNDVMVDAIQPDDFVLFTLNFMGVAEGTSNIELDNVSLIYAFEEPIPTFDVVDGSVTVTSNVVPEPATMILFGTGVLGMFARSRKV